MYARVVATALLLSGCGFVNARMLSYQGSPEADAFCHRYRHAIDKVRHEGRYLATNDRNYALYNLTLGIAALEYGDAPAAIEGFRNATDVFGAGVGRAEGLASIFLTESIKYFKGGVHERELAFLLQGLAYLHVGDLEAARASFRTSLLMDSLSSVPTMADDLSLGHYLLARTMERLGDDPDNLRIAWGKVASTSPGCAYCTPERARGDNAVFVVGLGRPVLRTWGATKSVDAYRGVPSQAVWCDVRLDGRSIGKCAMLYQGWQQATGQDPAKRHGIQLVKGVAVDAGTPSLDAVTGGHWTKLGGDEMGWADLRAVPVFPGAIGLVTARVPPGVHTLEVVGLDRSGAAVESTSYRRQFFAVPEDREVVTFLRLDEFRQTGLGPRDPMQCGTANELDYSGEDGRFQTTYEKFWPSGQTPQYVRAPLPPARVVACLDGMSCSVGSRPALLGGQDFRVPSERVLAEWHAAGHFSTDGLFAVAERYRSQGYVLPGDGDPRQCGRHAAEGGRCLIPPLPGTPLFDRIVSGGGIDDE